jgi:GTPase SAR1 family protein
MQASNAVDVLLQCAAFCTSLQSLRLGANRFVEAELRDELSKSGLPLKLVDGSLLRHLAYEGKKTGSKSSLEECGRIGCQIVKLVAQGADEKHRSLLSARTQMTLEKFFEGINDLSSLLVPERVDDHLQCMMQVFVPGNVMMSSSEYVLYSMQPCQGATSIQFLNLSSCNMGPSSHRALISVLQRLLNLLELNLSQNCFPADSICDILQEAPSSLTTLIVRNAGISASGLHAAKAKRFLRWKFVSIAYIDVSDNTELEIAGFACLLQFCPTQNLISLRASNCGFNLCSGEYPDCMESVFSKLHDATSLQALDLSKNLLGVAGVEAIIRSLSPDPQNFGFVFNRDIFSKFFSNCHLGSWVSPLKYMNLSCATFEEVSPSLMHQFNNWFNTVLTHFANLTHLYLSENNCLFNLHSTVSCLDKLEFIDLSYCANLVSISDQLILARRSRKFEILLLHCDALEYPPKSIADQGLDAMSRFIRENEKEKEHLNHVKVVVLGNGGTGKRSLVHALAKADSSRDKSFKVINDDIFQQYRSRRSFAQTWAQKFNQRPTPSLSFWNFGGHLECYPHLKFYMAARQCVYIVVFNVLDSPDVLVQQISHWLCAILDRAGSRGSIRIFLIGTHVDKIAPSLIFDLKKTTTAMIRKLLGTMGLLTLVEAETKQINLDWFFSTDPKYNSDVVARLTDSIFQSSAEMLQGPNILLFPTLYNGMKAEVERLALLCEQKKKFPLLKLANLTREEGCEILAGSDRNLCKLEAIELLSEAGMLISYRDFQGEPWICVNANFCVGFVMLFTNHALTCAAQPTFGNQSVMSKDGLYKMFVQFFQSEETSTSVSWYSSSFDAEHLDSLIGLLVAQELLFPVPAERFRGEVLEPSSFQEPSSAVADETLYIIPLFMKPKPKLWKEVLYFALGETKSLTAPSWGLQTPIKIQGLRFSSRSDRFMITVSSFLKLMLQKCNDPHLMWGLSFLYHVDGTSLYVRLADDRRAVDVISIGPDASTSAAVALEVQHIELELELDGSPPLHICPLCCCSENYIVSASARLYSHGQLDRLNAADKDAICHQHHHLKASHVETGCVIQMPAARDPNAESFFPDMSFPMPSMCLRRCFFASAALMQLTLCFAGGKQYYGWMTNHGSGNTMT